MPAPSVRIEPVTTWRLRRAFVDLPWSIYRDDPNWIAPLKWEQRRFLSPRHPFRRHGEAQAFLAFHGNRPVGRILVSDDPNYNQLHRTNLGAVGMFECADGGGGQVARALLHAAAKWLALRGRTRLLGPLDFSTNYPCGLLVDGFDTPPVLMMSHHRPTYAAMLESAGLTKARDLFCFRTHGLTDDTRQWLARASELTQQSSVTIRHLDRRRWRREIELCRTVYHQAWRNNWGFVPMTDAEFAALARDLRFFADERLLLLAEADGQPVGLSLIVPDLNEAIRPLNGRLFRFGLPLGLWQLKRNLRHVRGTRSMILGVLPAWQRLGVGAKLILATLDHVKQSGRYDHVEMGWILEDNHAMLNPLRRLGFIRSKTYRIYEAELGSLMSPEPRTQ
ncbi:MAG: GNAT family N-acetyltransferase [Phycisphaeraceae bacterium]|nr:GNAT family N-acetyltransferase [Phycisphaeraceae bacterium]